MTNIFKYKKLKSDAEKGELNNELMGLSPDPYQLRYVTDVKPKFIEQGKTSAKRLCKDVPKIVGRDIEW